MKKDKKPRVLIFEDRSIYTVSMTTVFGDDADVVIVTGLTKNLARYMRQGLFDVIVMDGNLSGVGDGLETEQLTRDIRAGGYTGPLIANSASSASNKALILAGCDYDNGGHKAHTPWKVAELLGLKRVKPSNI